MKKFLKIFAWIAGIVLGLLLLLVIVLPLVFDPNQYKNEIIQGVKSATGRDLKIEGKIGWSLFPRLGISTNGVELGNAPGFGREPFARINSATVSVELLPLLHGRIDVGTIAIDGLTLNLAKSAAGHTNWEDLSGPTHEQKPTAQKSTGAEKHAALPALTAGKLDIRHSTVTWHDLGTGERYALRDFSLDTGPLAFGKPIDLRMSVELEYGQPAKHAQLRLISKTLIAENKLALKPFELRIDDSRFTGSVEILHPADPAYRFDLALDQIDLDKYLPPAPPRSTAAKPSPVATGAPAPIAIPISLLRSLDVQGTFAIGKLTAFGIRSGDIHTRVNARGGLIEFGPNRATLYNGSYVGHTTLDVRRGTPQMKFDEKLEHVQLGPLLHDAELFDAFSGNGNVQLALSAAGNDDAAIKRTLNGKVTVSIKDGAIEGIDLVKTENQIKAARQQSGDNLQKLLAALPAINPQKGDKTTFSQLGASAVVTDGVVANDDLALEGPHIHVRGKGRVNLVTDQYENYVLSVSEVPLIVTGALADPKIRPDWNAIAKRAVEHKVDQEKKKLEQKLQDKLDRFLRKRN